MGVQNDSEKRVVIKEKNGNIEIYPLKTENCDEVKSLTVDYLIKLFISDIIHDIDTSRLTILQLPQCNLTDLPDSCKKLNLKHLDLSRNKLTSIPVCLYTGLKHLESLDLSHNKIEQFDMEPECLLYLKVVLLNNNNFENAPKWFLTFRSTNLEEFDYSHNKAKHYKYLKISFNLNFLKLKKLSLKNSCLIDSDYDFLKCFKSLTYLDISNEGERLQNLNKFKDLDDLFVKLKWKELHVLRLQNLALSIFPEGIAWIETLRELYLTNNCLSWLPDDIQFLVNLEILDISNNSIIAIPSILVSLEKLKILHASDNSIETVPDFFLMRNLNTLDLYNNLLDEFSCNLCGIDFVDVEDNYYDTKYIENPSVYEEKKNCLRNKYSYMRGDGPKVLSSIYDGSSSASTDSDDYYQKITNFETVCSNHISMDETENWDLPVRIKPRDPEIDSVDENWEGGDIIFYLNDRNKKDKIYVSDEDWMFVDFEES